MKIVDKKEDQFVGFVNDLCEFQELGIDHASDQIIIDIVIRINNKLFFLINACSR